MILLIVAAVVSCIGANPLSLQGLQVKYTVNISTVHDVQSSEPVNWEDSGLFFLLEIEVIFAPISKLTVTHSTVTNDFFTQVKSHPIYFSYENGTIREIFVDTSVPEQILNFQRGLVSGLQLPLKGHNGRIITWERDVLGDCRLTIVRSDNIVVKSKETHLCTGRPAFTTLIPSQIQEAKVAYGQMSGEYELAESSSDRFYVRTANLSQLEHFAPMTKTAGSTVSFVGIWFAAKGEPELVQTPPLPTNYKNASLMFSYYSSSPLVRLSCDNANGLLHELASCHPSDVPRLFLELIKTLRTCSLNELKDLHKEYGIKKPELESLPERMRKYFLDALAYVGTEATMSFIVDAIQNPEYRLSNARQHELINSVTFIPYYYTSPCVILSKTLEMTKKSPTWQTSSLTLGSVINSVLDNVNEDCSSEIKEAVEWLIEKLNSNLTKVPPTFTFAKEPTEEEKRTWENAVHAIKALGNAGSPMAIPALSAAIKQTKLLTVGRSAAVYALKRIASRSPFQVREVCRKIILNEEEDEEVRIAAFSVFVTSIHSKPFILPSYLQLMQVMTQVSREPKMPVKSHMCRMLTQLRTTTDPYLIESKNFIFASMKRSRAFVSCAVTEFPCFASSYIRGYRSFADLPLPRQLPRDLAGAGFRLSYYTQSGRTIPDNVFAKIYGHAFGYHFDLFEVGVRTTGVNRLIQKLFGPVGYFRLLARNFTVSNLKRPEGFSMDLQSLDDNMTVSGFVKLLGNELSWNHNEQPNILRLLYEHCKLTPLREELSEVVMEEFNFQQLPRLVQAWKSCEKKTIYEKLISHVNQINKVWNYLTKGRYNLDGGELNVTKTGSYMDIQRTIPTIIGFPLNMTAVGIGHFGMDAEGSIDYYAEGWQIMGNKRDRFEMTGSLNPRLAVLSQVNITLDAYYAQPKLVFSGNMTSNFTQRGHVYFYDNYTVNMQLYEMPENESLLINSSYDVFIQVGNFTRSLGIEKRKTTTVFEPFGDNVLGIMLVSNISFPYYKGMDGKALEGTPWFPLSGPANMTLAFQRVVPVSKLNFTFYNVSNLISHNGTYNATVEAVGTPLRISANVSWGWNETTNHREISVNISAGSIYNQSGHYFFQTQINTTDFSNRALTREAWINSTLKTDTHYNNLTVYVRGGRFNGTIHRTRHTQKEVRSLIKTLTEFRLDVNGTVRGLEMLNVSMYLHNKEGRLTHQLHANASTNLTHFNLTVNSTLFKDINISYCYASEVRRAFCHQFGDNIVTFDGFHYKARLASNAEFTLTRHRHPNDTFGITLKGKDVLVYLNGTIYTLTPDHTQFKVDDEFVSLPHENHRTINVRKVFYNNQVYVRLSAFAGVDIVYSPDDTMISISRFFRNQTGGLCGNANANGTQADELELPSYEIAESINDFVSKWVTPEPIDFESFVYECSPDNETVQTCTKIFYEIMKRAHNFVDPHPYYQACLCDKLGYLPSLRAYAKAAHIKGISLDGCIYSKWEPSSECENGKQSLTRSVLENPLNNECTETTMQQDCSVNISSHPFCQSEKTHLIQNVGQKVCRSIHRHVSCGKCCTPVYGKPVIAYFYCISNSDPIENLGNASPVLQSIFPVELCEPVKNYWDCFRNEVEK